MEEKMHTPREPVGESVCESSATGELRLGLAAGGTLRWAAVDLRAPLEDARRRLDLSPVSAVALGRALSAAALLLRFTTKRPGRLSLEVQGDGPLGRIVAEATQEGYLRGLLGDPRLPLRAGEGMKIGWAVGQGTFKVVQTTRQGSYESQVKLVTGEIGGDLVHYLEQSQQIHSAALLGVLPRPDGIAQAGGVLVEALPGTTEEELSILETNVRAMSGISTVLDDGGLDGAVETLLAGFDREELESHTLRYGCGRGREQVVEKLQHLTAEDLAELLGERDDFAADCAYCQRRFVVRRDELDVAVN